MSRLEQIRQCLEGNHEVNIVRIIEEDQSHLRNGYGEAYRFVIAPQNGIYKELDLDSFLYDLFPASLKNEALNHISGPHHSFKDEGRLYFPSYSWSEYIDPSKEPEEKPLFDIRALADPTQYGGLYKDERLITVKIYPDVIIANDFLNCHPYSEFGLHPDSISLKTLKKYKPGFFKRLFRKK